MKDPQFIRSATVLEVVDLSASIAFYRGKLGFEQINQWGEPPVFAILRRGQVTLFLDQSCEKRPAPVNQYWAAYIYIDDVEAYAAELKSRGVGLLRGPETSFYNIREIDIRDPDGHIICFGQSLDPPADGPGL